MDISSYSKRVGSANGDTTAFDPAFGIPINEDSLTWDVLPDPLRVEEVAQQEWIQAEQHGALPEKARNQHRRGAEERLRAADPW